MIGLRVNFGAAGPLFDFTAPVYGFDATVQCCLINTGTDVGSDPVYPERGTYLKQDAARGKMASTVWANQSASVAALRTLAFMQQNDAPANQETLKQFDLSCYTLQPGGVLLQAQAISSEGAVRGGLAKV